MGGSPKVQQAPLTAAQTISLPKDTISWHPAAWWAQNTPQGQGGGTYGANYGTDGNFTPLGGGTGRRNPFFNLYAPTIPGGPPPANAYTGTILGTGGR